MIESHFIYLIPGFFGFANLGRLRYFVHVHDHLRARFAARGIPAQIHVVRTLPTASLPERAARLLETIAATMGRRSGVVHLIGHSSGGLDARLVAAPDVALPTKVAPRRYADRIGSVITVATPHRGSPLAALLATNRGQRLLAFLSLITAYVLRFGHLPVAAILSLATAFGRAEILRLQRTLLDDISEQLLADFSVARRRAVQRLLGEVTQDQSLLVQLMGEAMEVFNATVRDRPGVRYGCVVTRGRPPGVRTTLATGADPAAQAMHAAYQALYRLTARPSLHGRLALTAAQRRALGRAYGELPGPRANDGIVPTQSQVWGTIVAAVQADHLDVIGHFNDARADPPHFDWLTTQSGFTARQFAGVWDAVVAKMLG
jgi:triacylglycerol esterase/lipase EstA (alpha/beta hydrolase family)